MSDTNNETDDLQVETENPLANMIDFTANNEFNKANEIFNDIMNQRIHDTLDQARMAIANGTFNQDEEESDMDAEDTESEISDEDLEASAEDMANDESDEDGFDDTERI